ncbi:uncharacterized protein LOC107372237 isoform X2 [Tetranychus urticae]|uniref:uncharacterized protein LOC107372237 isoform X2 n=1 Tax=Tetranychus urticae TaxID=32264 RepID=UPI00077BF70C|nr:uncharacterized protein LOC107372237 isoform X2 [Tetranychus urticae]
MSKGLFKGKVVIEEETEDDRGKVTDQLNNSVAAIDIESRIVVEESLFETEDEDEASNISMTVDDDDPKPSSKTFKQNNIHGTKESSVDDCGSEALDLSFIPCSIPLKKRKISSLPNSDNSLNEDKKKSDHHFHQKIITRDTSAFNQLTNHNRLNSFNLQSSHNHFPFTLRAMPSAASSSTSNCKPLSLVKNQQAQQPQQHFHHQNQLNFNHLYHQQQHQNQNNHHQLQQQKLVQYQQNQQKQEFTIGNKSTGLGSSTSGQTKGHCTIGKPSGEQEPRGVSVNRCKACWLKICLEKFILDSETRIAIDKYYAPKFLDSADSPTSNDAIPGGGSVDEGSEGNTVNSEEGGEARLTGKSGVGEGDGETGKSLQSAPCDRIETNGCDTTISPPPLPFPQRKRKPKNELATSLSSSSTSSSSPSSSSSTSINHMNTKNTPTTGESIPLSTSQSGNHSRNKEKHHQSQYHSLSSSSHHTDNRSRESLSFGHPSTGHLLTEPLCLTTSGRRSDLFSSGVIGNQSCTPRSSSSTFASDKHLGLTPLGPRYPWSHRRKDDYELTSPLTTQTSQNNLIHRGNDDDLNDLYHVDYSLNSPDLVLGGSFGSVSHFIKDMSGDADVDGNFMVMGSPSSPPPPAARCGKCSYCLPTIDEKANVVVVKENCGPVRCRLAEIMSKSNQSLSNNKGVGDENGGGATLVTSTAITATSTTQENEGNPIGGDSKHNNKRPVSTTSEGDEDIVDEDYCHGSSHASKGQGEETVHSSTPISSLVNVNNTNNRRNRKDRRGHSKGGGGGGDGGGDKEESESDIGSQEGMINGDENLDQESRESNRDGYRKRFVSGDDDDQGVSMRFHGSRSSKSNKSVMFNKPYKKLLINEHFVNSSLINNQASNSNNHSNLLSTRDLAGSVISPDSNFLSEILNANSPFL